MQLERTNVKIRCEMGACKCFATHTIHLARVGIRSRIHVCGGCLCELGALIAAETAPPALPVVPVPPVPPPRSFETLKGKRHGADIL